MLGLQSSMQYIDSQQSTIPVIDQFILKQFIFYFVVGTTREQLGFALCLQVPIFVVVTKVDSCRSAILEKNLANMEQLLKSPGSNKIPTRISSESDAVNAATRMSSSRWVLSVCVT